MNQYLEYAYEFVKNFRYTNLITKKYNKFEFEYKVPSVNGLSIYQRNKDLDSVKPCTLEYIIYHLQNAEVKIIHDAVVAYLYYWKIRKNDTKMMIKKYNEIKHHYIVKHNEVIPSANIKHEAIVYSISFYVGSIKINKFGLTTDKDRYKKLVSDIKSKYEFISVGNLTINQEIQFKTLEQAELFEDEAIKNLKKHELYSKCKNCFDGYKEAYLYL